MKTFFEDLQIRNILIVSFLLLSLIPLLLLTTLIYQYTKTVLIQTATTNLEAIADRQGEQIRSYILEKELNVKTLAKSPLISGAIETITSILKKYDFDSIEYKKATASLENFLHFYLTEAKFDDLFLISEDRQAIFSVKRGEDLGSNYHAGIYQETELAKVIDRAITLQETQISEFAYYPATNEPALFIASPVMTQEGVLGAVVLQLSNDEVYQVVNNYTGLQETGETFIVAKIGNYLTYLTPTRFDPYAPFKKRIPLNSQEGNFLKQVIYGKTMKGMMQDYRGEETLFVGKYFLPELGWGMVVKIDTEEIFTPISNIKWMASIITLLTAIGVFLAAYLIAQHLAKPIIYLMQKANLIAEGNLSEPIQITSKNEIGRLAFSFNEMTMKLKNIIEHLDELVKERTLELTAAQDRLIVQENLASLGALTAGIAHEIKNPLNFVNNFSSLSLDLIDELKQKINSHTPLIQEEIDQFAILKENLTAVVAQGKKADNIVQRMLAHARAGKGSFAEADMNKLITEYLELTYHGTQTNDIPLNITIEKHFDPSLPSINIIAEDVGRVLLNIFNNAFYAMNQKRKIDSHYLPLLTIDTKNLENFIEIRIKDNGIGMTKEATRHIFTPFFTTKPPGEGTGLGLSLSYNIVVQEHGGKFTFHTEEDKYTEFVIELPKSN